MLDKEKCKYLIKTAQFEELQKVLEKEYIEIFDNFLLKKFPKDKVDGMSLTVKAKQIMILKPQARGIMLRFMNAYLNDGMLNTENIQTLLNLYKNTYEILK